MGRSRSLILYEAILLWDDEPLTVDVAIAETEPLMGMSLIYGHDLRIKAIEGGAVTIESLTCRMRLPASTRTRTRSGGDSMSYRPRSSP